MEFFKQNTKIDFMKLRKWAVIFSSVIILASVASLFVNGINWGLDFTGGTQIQVSYKQAANLTEMRSELAKIGFEDIVVQSYGAASNALIRVSPHESIEQAKLTTDIMAALPGATLQKVEYIGPVVGKALANNGALALIISLLAIMAYIAFRFEWRFSLSAVIALVHDPLLIMGVFSFFHIEFNLIALAAVLTVIGYSLNDTIVIFDRIRENFRKVRTGSAADIVNISVNQTLSRTIMTSGLTLIAVLALFIFGGAMLHAFSMALLVGIVIGTYSSIYIAGALAVALGMNKQDLMPVAKTELDSRP